MKTRINFGVADGYYTGDVMPLILCNVPVGSAGTMETHDPCTPRKRGG